MSKKINIAIDGYSSCGKSTLTKQLAQELGYIYVDTGSMYRAITYYFLTNRVNLKNDSDIQSALEKINLTFNEEGYILLNDQEVENKIRTLEVSDLVSEVAALSAVRNKIVQQLQSIADNKKGIIMDGRDIGTVVMPNAELKLFMTADTTVRVDRRYNELLAKGDEITKKEILDNLQHRDYIDTHRKDSPLVKAEDAILIDNSHLTKQQQLNYVVDLVNKKLNN